MAGTIVADNIQAASTSTLVLKNGVANTPPTIQDSGGTEIGTFCRAWVNFNGTGTVAIRASFNVSSITDNGTGNYTVNFATAMPDANYSAVITSQCAALGGSTDFFVGFPTSGYGTGDATLPTSSSVRLTTKRNAATPVGYDMDIICVSIFR
jgi:hypothetical protein